MKPQKVEKSEKEVKVVFADEKQGKEKQFQTKLADLAEKKAKGKLTLEGIDEKLDMIIEMLQDLMPLE